MKYLAPILIGLLAGFSANYLGFTADELGWWLFGLPWWILGGISYAILASNEK